MSILQQVIDEYGISEKPEGLTDKTAKRSNNPKALTDKTAKRASVSSVSEWSELLENKNGELEPEELPVALEMVEIVEMRERGEIPAHYTTTINCKHCGPVPIFEGQILCQLLRRLHPQCSHPTHVTLHPPGGDPQYFQAKPGFSCPWTAWRQHVFDWRLA